jgi:hypothetical protein
MAGSTTKTYTIHSSCINVTGGRYKSSSPSSAAKKAASMLFRRAAKMPKQKSCKKITFCLRESTSGSDKKMFDYSATRVKLVKPIVRVINGVEIVNKFKITVKALKTHKAPEAHKSPKKNKTGRKTKGGCDCNK